MLVDEIKSKSNVSYSDAMAQVNEFSKTDEFYIAHDKWRKLKAKRPLPTPKSMKDIFKQMGM